MHRMIGEYESAKDLLQKSLDIYKQIRPANHPDIGRNILNLGIITRTPFCMTDLGGLQLGGGNMRKVSGYAIGYADHKAEKY